MIILFASFVILYLYFTYRVNNKNVFSFAMILGAISLVQVIGLAISTGTWQIEIDIRTVIIIAACLIAFLIGEQLAKHTRFRMSSHRKTNSNGFSYSEYVYTIKPYVIGLMSVISLVTLVLTYRYDVSVLSRAGYSGNILNILTFIKSAYNKFDTKLDTGTILTMLQIVDKAFAYICFYSFYNNRIVDKRYAKKKCLIPCFIYLVRVLLLSITRTGLIRLLIAIIVLIAFAQFTNSRGKTDFKFNRSAIRISVLLFLFLIFLFCFQQSLRRNENISDTILIYLCGSIVALNFYITEGVGSTSGFETFNILFESLRKRGFSVPNTEVVYPYAYWKSNFGITGTNVYTAIKPYMHDYGVLGAIFLYFLIAFIYRKAFDSCLRNNYIARRVAFASFVFPIFMLQYSDQFLNEVVQFSPIIHIFIIYLFSKFTVHTKPIKRTADSALTLGAL